MFAQKRRWAGRCLTILNAASRNGIGALVAHQQRYWNLDHKLFLIHVGKCGGASLNRALQKSGVKFEKWVHIFQPPIDAENRYVIVTRAPIARALSAFNWRYHLVIETAAQPDRFPGEREILLYYKSLNALAEALYFEDGTENALAQGNFRSIHHLGESIAFYLDPLLREIDKNQIQGVISQESLSENAHDLLGVPIERRVHVHRPNTPQHMLKLSVQARKNLLRYLHRDFACMTILDSWGLLSAQASAALTQELSVAEQPDDT